MRAILLASVIATSVRVFGQHAPEPRAFFGRIFVHSCTDHRHGPNDEQPSDKTGRGQVSAPIFILVPQVKLRKLLNLARDVEPAAGRVPG